MKSLLFNDVLSPLVKSGVKTTTRRFARSSQGDKGDYCICDDGTFAQKVAGYNTIYDNMLKPKYYIGETVYLLEAYKISSCCDETRQLQFEFKDGTHSCVNFSAERYSKFKKFYGKNGWQSPYFFPVEAARYFYDITDIKVNLLNDMNSEDCFNEGIQRFIDNNGNTYYSVSRNWKSRKNNNISLYTTPENAFRALWNDTVPKNKPEALWENNPYVFVYTFKGVEK